MADDRETIQTCLKDALEERGVGRIVYARSNVPPPLYAFVVNFPSATLALEGCYEFDLAGDNGSAVCSLEPGDILYTPANCWYRPTWKHPSRTLTLLFGRKQTGFSLVRSEPGEGGPTFDVYKHHTAAKLTSLCRNLLGLCDEARQPPHHSDIAVHLVNALLLSCVELLEHHHAAVLTKPRVLYESLCSYIQEHFHQHLTRDEVAAAFDITPNHLSRLFRTEGLMRFWDYVTLVRLDRAKFMLIQYNIPVKTVAAHCGFTDTTYFCRVFKRRMKQTPLQYRLKYGHRRSQTRD